MRRTAHSRGRRGASTCEWNLSKPWPVVTRTPQTRRIPPSILPRALLNCLLKIQRRARSDVVDHQRAVIALILSRWSAQCCGHQVQVLLPLLRDFPAPAHKTAKVSECHLVCPTAARSLPRRCPPAPLPAPRLPQRRQPRAGATGFGTYPSSIFSTTPMLSKFSRIDRIMPPDAF